MMLSSLSDLGYHLDPKRGWVNKNGEVLGNPPPTKRYNQSHGTQVVGQTYHLDSIEDSAALLNVIHGGDNATSSGQLVNASNALQVATVYRCVNIIADSIASLPIKVKVYRDNLRDDAKKHQLWRILTRSPNHYQTPFGYVRLLVRHMLLQGNHYSLKIVVGDELMGLVPLEPRNMSVSMRGGKLVYTYNTERGKQVYSAEQILHFRGASDGGYVGQSVIQYAAGAIGVGLATEQHAGATFKNGARPSGVLEMEGNVTRSPEAVARLKKQFNSHVGANSGGTPVLEEGMTFKPITMTADEAQFLETRQFTRSEICAFFGVPPHLAGDVSTSTSWGSGIEQQGISFVQHTLQPWITEIEQSFMRDCIDDPDYYVKFNVNALLRGDLKTRSQFYKDLLSYSVLSPNEVRALEDMNPRDDGDIYFAPPNANGNDDEKK